MCDLGSGDGSVVIRAAKETPLQSCWGVELNYWLVLYSRFSAFQNGVHSRCKFVRKDLWKTDYSKTDILVVIAVPDMMPLIESKIACKLSPDALVICVRFPLSSWKSSPELLPSHIIEGDGGPVDGIWAYRVSDNLNRVYCDNLTPDSSSSNFSSNSNSSHIVNSNHSRLLDFS